MPELPISWKTDLAVLEYTGSTVEDRAGYLVVRTPRNPTYHWGNCLLVTDPDAVEDAARWVDIFQREFPSATWIAVGLLRMPENTTSWVEFGLELELDDVLETTSLPRQTSLPAPYSVRRRQGDDREQVVVLAMAERERTARASYEPFVRARTRADQELSERDVAAFFGVFVGDALTASLGIVVCGQTAPYRNVGTDAPHRRQGLASHLLGVAARWAGGRGCDHSVIVTESTNSAGRVYRSVGFESGTRTVQAYKRQAK